MRILVLWTGSYGQKHIDTLQKRGPADWEILEWQTPRFLPPIIDYPEDYLPKRFPRADLILSLAELPGVAEMIPEIAQMCQATAVIAPIDSQSWLPYGRARQLVEWLDRINVRCVTPMPFCSLTPTHHSTMRLRQAYDVPLIRAFAKHFGHPAFVVESDDAAGVISQVTVTRDACCGCASFAAAALVGAPLDEAVERIGLHHHHYPCQASMGIDPLLGDTLLHVSGNIMKDALRDALGERGRPVTIRPAGYVSGGAPSPKPE